MGWNRVRKTTYLIETVRVKQAELHLSHLCLAILAVSKHAYPSKYYFAHK